MPWLPLQYPSGRTITYTVSAVGRPLTAKDTASGINYATGNCAGGACYAPQGALSSVVNGQAGGFNGITVSYGYNNRRWVSSISATSSAGTALKPLVKSGLTS